MPADGRIRRGAAATISVQLVDQYGDPAEASGTVTVGVVDATGASVLASGTATSAVAGSTGVYSVGIPAAVTAALGLLTATWTDDGDDSIWTTHHEVVGAFYASVAAIRASDPSLSDPAKYSDSVIRAGREVVEYEFEDICGRAFVPRYRRRRLTSRGGSTLVLPEPDLRSVQAIETVNSDGTTTVLTASDVATIDADPVGVARLGSGFPAGDIIVTWEAGTDRPPADVLDAFYTRVRDVLNRKHRTVPDRTSSFTSSENGTFTLVVPGQRGSITGIPDVDVVLRRYDSEALVA